MGNVHVELAQLPIVASVTHCHELVIAIVSNWGVCGIIAALRGELHQDLFGHFDPVEIVRYLVDRGAVDGKTGYAECSEDGFPLAVGLTISEQLRELISPRSKEQTI
jgi:hypothetical protein